jgi:hypothetical protein
LSSALQSGSNVPDLRRIAVEHHHLGPVLSHQAIDPVCDLAGIAGPGVLHPRLNTATGRRAGRNLVQDVVRGRYLFTVHQIVQDTPHFDIGTGAVGLDHEMITV